VAAWLWEEVDVNRSGSSGDLSKLFKNEGVKRPGVLKRNAPPTDATLLAREAIQNSWDAGIALARELRSEGREPPRFTLRFVYKDFTGDEKNRLIRACGLRELAERASRCDRRELGLADQDCLDDLDEPGRPLSALYVEESGTTGMGGPWKGAASKLYLALVSIGFTAKAKGAGGSYGYGKAGLIRASAIRTVVAHTCFREHPDEPGVTRRLLGMTYWGQHSVDGTPYTGFARLGRQVDDDVAVPFDDDDADDRAIQMSMRKRSPESPEDLGSSFLLIDPTVDPEALCRAVEINWWPAIITDKIDIEIETSRGDVLHPRPKRDDVLMTFIRGYEIATQPQDNKPENEFKRELQPYQPRGGDRYRLGTIGLVADLAGWSYDNATSGDDTEDGGVDHQSLVALVRGPHMVVEYYPAARTPPHVRGTFLAHEDVDDLLRQTEPRAHDAWLPSREEGEEGIHPDAPKVAKQVLRRIRHHVQEFRQQLKPQPDREHDVRLPLLDDLLRGILENRGDRAAPPPPADPRLISIGIDQKPEIAPGGRVRMRARAHFALTQQVDRDDLECRIGIRYAFDEDGALGDNCPLSVVRCPDGFRVVSQGDTGTVIEGRLTREATAFEVVSEPYDPDWTGQLIVKANPVDPAMASNTGTDRSGDPHE